MIPKIIWQTWKSKDINKEMLDAKKQLISLNPDYEYNLYTDQDCINFIGNNFHFKYLVAYLQLPPGAFRADLWRYLILYKYGGIYIDIDSYVTVGFDFILNNEYKFISVSERRNIPGIYNGFIMCVPNLKIIQNVIDRIVIHATFKYYPSRHISDEWTNILEITGPVCLLNSLCHVNKLPKYTRLKPGSYTISDGDILLLEYRGSYIYKDNDIIMSTKYKGYPASALDYKHLVDNKLVYNLAKTWYMWGFKPNEKRKIPNQFFYHNSKCIPYNIQIIKPIDCNNIVSNYSKQLYTLWNKIPRWIMKADIMRLLYVYTYGGFYLDIDVRLSKYIIPNTIDLFVENHDMNTNNSIDRINKAQKLRIANYAFGSLYPKNSFFKKCIDLAYQRIELLLHQNTIITDNDVLWASGPDVITNIYHTYKDDYDIQLHDILSIRHYQYGSWRIKNNDKYN